MEPPVVAIFRAVAPADSRLLLLADAAGLMLAIPACTIHGCRVFLGRMGRETHDHRSRAGRMGAIAGGPDRLAAAVVHGLQGGGIMGTGIVEGALRMIPGH